MMKNFLLVYSLIIIKVPHLAQNYYYFGTTNYVNISLLVPFCIYKIAVVDK